MEWIRQLAELTLSKATRFCEGTEISVAALCAFTGVN